MKLLSLSSLKDNSAEPTATRWPWPPYCHQPKTLSFRGGDDVFRTINSAFIDPPEPWRRRRLANSPSFTSTEPEVGRSERYAEDDDEDDAAIKTAVTAARSERRLFFEPEETSCILDRPATAEVECPAPFIEESVAMSMESRDPYVDFRRSMGEMCDFHALGDKWERLEELLCWYLKANDKANHGYIFSAFVDLLVTIQATSNNSSQSPSSPLSFYTSSTTSNSCCSSSTLSTPCCVSGVEAEESSASSSESVAAVKSSLVLNVAEPMADDSSSSSLDV